MSSHTVVINDCSAATVVGGPISIRTRDTAHGSANFKLNFSDVAGGLPRQLNDRELDWLDTVGGIYAIDLACGRGEGDVAWARDIRAHLPAREPDFWNEIAPSIEEIFADFTMDRLRLEFHPEPSTQSPPRQSQTPFPDHDSVALFSGGVDSFVGTGHLLAEGLHPIAVAHTAAGAITHAQAFAEEVMKERSPSFRRVPLTARKYGTTFPGPEPSQRSRSFLFLAAAAVMASVGGSNRVFINENGIMAIHVPMTSARIGSLSTHTASPVTVERVAKLASSVLGSEITMQNLLVSRTKPEVVGLGRDLNLGAALPFTVSCWSIGRTGHHCGVCAPCIMRRISFELHDLPDAEYTNDAFEDPTVLDRPFALDNLTHLVQLVDELITLDDLEMQLRYPEILNGSAVLPVADCSALYRRWASQASEILFSHSIPPQVR